MTSRDGLIAVLRGLSVALLLSVFGALLFRCVIAPKILSRTLSRWSAISLMVALVISVVWFGMEAASIAGAESLGGALAALWPVATETWFGQLWLARMALLLLLAAYLLLGRSGGRPWAGAALAGGALALQAGMGHAFARGGALGEGLVGSEVLHLLAAGAWLGGLVPLLFVLHAAALGEAATVARRFSPLGLSCVLILAGTALVQGSAFAGGWSGLLGTAYGTTMLVKLALFLLLLALAAVNRFVLTAALQGTGGRQARRRMQATVSLETVLGLMVVIAAGVLASLPPGAHD